MLYAQKYTLYTLVSVSYSITLGLPTALNNL